jgi:hypothetical protein
MFRGNKKENRQAALFLHQDQVYTVKTYPDLNFFVITVIGYDFTQKTNGLCFVVISEGGRLFK